MRLSKHQEKIRKGLHIITEDELKEGIPRVIEWIRDLQKGNILAEARRKYVDRRHPGCCYQCLAGPFKYKSVVYSGEGYISLFWYKCINCGHEWNSFCKITNPLTGEDEN